MVETSIPQKTSYSTTVCTLIFVGFNVCGFRGLAAIRKNFVSENLDINRYAWNNGQHLQISKCEIANMESLRNIYNPDKN